MAHLAKLLPAASFAEMLPELVKSVGESLQGQEIQGQILRTVPGSGGARQRLCYSSLVAGTPSSGVAGISSMASAAGQEINFPAATYHIPGAQPVLRGRRTDRNQTGPQ